MYIDFYKEKNLVRAFDAITLKIDELEEIKNKWPSQFNLESQRDYDNYCNGRTVLSDLLENVTDSQLTKKKYISTSRQIVKLIDILMEPGFRVTDNQGLSIENAIFRKIAKIVGDSFFYFCYHDDSREKFQRAQSSRFDSREVVKHLQALKQQLFSQSFKNYVELEACITNSVKTIIKMKEVKHCV